MAIIPNGSAPAYIIETDRWGITSGIPAKPYTDSDYLRADANVQGINSAIQWASDNGYRYLIMPYGEYPICYPKSILITASNLTIDFSNATLKVIYDSNRKSPFDNRTGATDYYNFPGNGQNGVGIKLQSVTNTHITNLVLIGNKADRSFNQAAEASVEWTYGIQIIRGSSYCSVKNCKISSFMGDGISIDSSSRFDYAEFGLGLTANEVDRQTGALIPAASGTAVSQMIAIPAGTYDSFLIAGAGYSRLTALNVKEVDVVFYTADNAYLTRYDDKKIYTPISIPSDARKLRLILHNETSLAKNMQITLKYGLTPHHNLIEYNEVFNIHRGGITLGGNYNIVQNNVIHDGTGLLDRKPFFTDPTRYGINQEDSYGDNCIVRNNLFYNLHHGLLAGCWTLEIHNNHFYNLTGIGINLYTLHAANVRENYLYRCQTGIGLMTAHITGAHVNIESNTLVLTPNTGLGGSGYEVHFHRNTLIDVNTFFMPDDIRGFCRENHFIWTNTFSGIPAITANRIESCTFNGIAVQRDIYFRTNKTTASVFTNMKVRIETRNPRTKEETVRFADCRFENSLLNNHITTAQQRTALFEQCSLTDSIVKIGNINTPSDSAITRLTNCQIVVKTEQSLFQNESNTGFGWIEVSRSSIVIENSGFLYFLSNVFNVAGTIGLYIKNSTITYTGAGRLNLSYYSSTNKRAVRTFLNARNIYTNINLPVGEAGIYIDYDPEIEGLKPPTSGHWFKGDTYGNAAPASGNNLGWVCVQSGIAASRGWAAATLMPSGERILQGGTVYEALNAGTTGSSAPAWPSALGQTVTDGGVTWQNAGPVALFKPYGHIFS